MSPMMQLGTEQCPGRYLLYPYRDSVKELSAPSVCAGRLVNHKRPTVPLSDSTEEELVPLRHPDN